MNHEPTYCLTIDTVRSRMAVMERLKNIVNFLFEVGILSKTPRSGFYFLGSGQQTVAEHLNRVTYIGYVLSMLEDDVNQAKVLKMCLFHDLAEARTSDLNYVHQKYAKADEDHAVSDLVQTLPFGEDIQEVIAEYKERKSKESLLAKDADNLEWLLSLKEQVDIGNKRAETWIPSGVKRLNTSVAREIATEILTTNSDEWWFSNKNDDWWVTRYKQNKDGSNEKEKVNSVSNRKVRSR